MSIYHPYEFVQPMTKERADEVNKFYWIGRWHDAARTRAVAGQKMAAAQMAVDPIRIGQCKDEYDRLSALVDESFKKARHFGAII